MFPSIRLREQCDRGARKSVKDEGTKSVRLHPIGMSEATPMKSHQHDSLEVLNAPCPSIQSRIQILRDRLYSPLSSVL